MKSAQSDRVSQSLFPGQDTFLKWPIIQSLYKEDEEITDETWTSVEPELNAQIDKLKQSQIDLCGDNVRAAISRLSDLQSFVERQAPGMEHDKLATRDLAKQIDFLSKFAYLFPHECRDCSYSTLFPFHLNHQCHAYGSAMTISTVRIIFVLDLVQNLSVLADKIPLHTQHLDDLGQLFECRRCADSGGTRYDWRLIVSLNDFLAFSG